MEGLGNDGRGALGCPDRELPRRLRATVRSLLRLLDDAVSAMAGFAKSRGRVKRRRPGNWKGLSMWTTGLAYVIMLMGFITFASGGLGAMILLFEEVSKTERVPWRYYAVVVGLISCGLSMMGIGQGLRLLLVLVGKD
jgi:hypothetical protein